MKTATHETYQKALIELVGTLNLTLPKQVFAGDFYARYGLGRKFFEALRDLDCIVLAPQADDSTWYTRTDKLLTVDVASVIGAEKKADRPAKSGKKPVADQTFGEEMAAMDADGSLQAIVDAKTATTMLDRALGNAEVSGGSLLVMPTPVSIGSVIESAKEAIDATTFTASLDINKPEFMCRCEQVPVRLCQEHGCLQAQNMASNCAVLPPAMPTFENERDLVQYVTDLLTTHDGSVSSQMFLLKKVRNRLERLNQIAEIQRKIDELLKESEDLQHENMND